MHNSTGVIAGYEDEATVVLDDAGNPILNLSQLSKLSVDVALLLRESPKMNKRRLARAAQNLLNTGDYTDRTVVSLLTKIARSVNPIEALHEIATMFDWITED